jgi:hypothetical protein
VFDQFFDDYERDPVRFVREVLDVEPDPAQVEVLEAYAKGYRRIAVKSGHGVGKSTLAAWILIFFIITRFPCKAVVTAPTTAQLFDALFSELKHWINRLPPALQELLEVKADRVELKNSPESAFISARTSRAETPEAMQGVHSTHVLLIADEASGVPEKVFEAGSGSMSGASACTILLGNPVRSSGFFYDVFHKLSRDWKTFTISCLDSPRVSESYCREMASRYGIDSNAYRIRVVGQFPLADDDTLIPMELIEHAMTREVEPTPTSPIIWGIDVARFGQDSCCLVERKGNTVTQVRVWSKRDTMQTTGLVKLEWDTLPPDQRPVEIMVDSIGIGAGVVDRLRELQLPAIGINVGESPSIAGQYLNLRSELWGKAKAWMEARDCKIPNNERLSGELAACKFKITSNGKIQIESKEEMRKRGFPSPDAADAFVLTFAGVAAIATHGRGPNSSWDKPLKRNLAGVV